METTNHRTCCCGTASQTQPDATRLPPAGSPESDRGSLTEGIAWLDGEVNTPVGNIPRVRCTLTWADRIGAWKMRWGIGRMRYRVEPGLYAAGTPDAGSPVLVTANYKMSFDRLRRELEGIDAWILILDTKAINVWCAAGKGTFGADEVVGRIESVRLAEVVSHRTVILPQLAAPGVAAHEVKQRSGFRVVYGPVRARDLPAFLTAGMKATPEMRRVEFPLRDRLAVVPVELVMGARYVVLIAAALLVLAGLGSDGYSWSRVVHAGTWSAAIFLVAFVGATVLTPALLPWLPGRPLAVKGLWIGLGMVLALWWGVWLELGGVESWFAVAGWCLLIPATTSFAAMNFTGATTYTSLSGVRREVRTAGPVQAVAFIVGIVLWLVGRFF